MTQTPFHPSFSLPISRLLPYRAIFSTDLAASRAQHWTASWLPLEEKQTLQKNKHFLKNPVVLHSRPNSFSFPFFPQILQILSEDENMNSDWEGTSRLFFDKKHKPTWQHPRTSISQLTAMRIIVAVFETPDTPLPSSLSHPFFPLLPEGYVSGPSDPCYCSETQIWSQTGPDSGSHVRGLRHFHSKIRLPPTVSLAEQRLSCSTDRSKLGN